MSSGVVFGCKDCGYKADPRGCELCKLSPAPQHRIRKKTKGKPIPRYNAKRLREIAAEKKGDAKLFRRDEMPEWAEGLTGYSIMSRRLKRFNRYNDEK